MAKKKTDNIVDKVENTAEALEIDLQTKRKDLFDAIRSHRTGELVNPKVISKYRKDIARVLTKLREAEITERKESK